MTGRMDAIIETAPQNPTKSEARNFAFVEYGNCREQIHLLLTAIWRFEVVAISGFGLFFAWFLGKDFKNFDLVNPLYILTVSTLFACLVLNRLKVEYAILLVLADYSKILEDYLYGRDAGLPVGWETFLCNNPPDDISIVRTFGRYKNAGIVFSLLVVLNIGFLAYLCWLRFGQTSIAV